MAGESGPSAPGAPGQGGYPTGPTSYTPPPLLFTKRLGFRLGLLVFVAVVPLFGFSVWSALRARDAAVRAASAEVSRLARLAARNQQAAVDQANRILQAAATQPWASGPDAGLAEELKAIVARSPDILDVQVLKADGSLVASALPPDASGGLCDKKVVDAVLKLKKPAAGDFEKSAGGTPRVFLARPFPGDRVLGASFSLAWLEQFQGLLQLPDGSVLDVVDPAGLNLLRLPKAAAGDVHQVHPVVVFGAAVYMEQEVPTAAEDTDGVRRYYGVSTLDAGGARKGFLVVVGIPEVGVIASANRALTTSLIVSTMVLILSLVLAQVMAEQFVIKRVNGLILATKRLATTDLAKLKARTRVCQDPSELGDLERSFDEMAKNLEQRAQELDRRAREMGGGAKA
jgi:hypothetical protein